MSTVKVKSTRWRQQDDDKMYMQREYLWSECPHDMFLIDVMTQDQSNLSQDNCVESMLQHMRVVFMMFLSQKCDIWKYVEL